jgi:hypothetical protein
MTGSAVTYACNGNTGPAGAPGNSLGTSIDLELDEISGTTFSDASGNGNVVTAPVGGIAAGAAGHTGKSVSFSGGVLSASPTKIPDASQVWVESWISPQPSGAASQVILSKPGSFTLRRVQQDVSFEVIGAASAIPCTATTTGGQLGVSGGWVHVAGWYDGLTSSVAVDAGPAVATSCPNGPVAPTPDALFSVGGLYVAPSTVSEPFFGSIDEIRVRPVAPARISSGPYHAEVNWTGSTSAGVTWTTLPSSTFTAITHGGPLLIYTRLFLTATTTGSHGSCQPVVDGVWAGTAGGLPDPGNYWREGLVLTATTGWHAWTPQRLYPGIPAGQHTFAVQCITDTGSLTEGDTSIGSSFGFIELPM